MKKLIILLLLLTSSLYAQDYPILSKDSLDNKTVHISLKQAQFVDKQLDVLELLKLMQIQCDDLNKDQMDIIHEQDQYILYQDFLIKESDELISLCNKNITKLEENAQLYDNKNKSYEDEIALRVSENNKLKRKLKWFRVYIIGGLIGGYLLSNNVIK